MNTMRNTGLAAAMLFLGAGAIRAQTYTNAFPGITFARPVWFGEVPGLPETYLVLQQRTDRTSAQGKVDTGSIVILRKQANAWVKETLLNVAVNKASIDEQGLLGFAFHPDFIANRKYYLNYNPPAPTSADMATVIEERTMDASALKDAGTSRQILKFSQPYDNHNGGTIAFGPTDKFLYIGAGDGGSAGDPQGRGQNLTVLLGKMLRIDVNNKSAGKEYAIPSDNPFAVPTAGQAPEIFAYGLRNPWKWSFDPVTGKLWVGDVGQNTQEEVSIVTKGGNYGWKIAEGYLNNGAGINPPVFAYTRTSAGGTSVTGGYVFRGSQASKYYGKYIFGDYNSHNVWALTYAGDTTRAAAEVLADAPDGPATFGIDSKGSLYLLGYTNGIVYRFDGPDWQPSPTASGPQAGDLSRSIGCIFSCRPGARLDAKAFGGFTEVAIFALSGERLGRLRKGADMPGLKAGLYLLRTAAGAKPNLLMIQ